LIGRYYFQKRLGLRWRQYIPVVAAGFACGMGLITTVGVERVKSPLYGADFSDPAVLGTLIDHLIDMLLAALMPAPLDG